MISVGELFKRSREKKGLTLRQVEKNIHVREKFLVAIESNDWSVFSSKIYIVGILKNYAVFLGIDHQKVIAFFRRDYERKEETNFRRRVSASYFRPETKNIFASVIAGVFFIFFIYFGYQLSVFLSPPKVSIIAPNQTVFRSTDQIHIVGKTEKEASIIIYGERVYPNREGIFAYDFPIKQGKNELIIEVTGGNGKKTVLKKIFILE
ncbi:hypothetical protein HGB07_01945 [Candidatus Roizmanbacteria bacterium]|nr:hypothetical protein [Candidatus Roizmanbacteria bacterium]